MFNFHYCFNQPIHDKQSHLTYVKIYSIKCKTYLVLGLSPSFADLLCKNKKKVLSSSEMSQCDCKATASPILSQERENNIHLLIAAKPFRLQASPSVSFFPFSEPWKNAQPTNSQLAGPH